MQSMKRRLFGRDGYHNSYTRSWNRIYNPARAGRAQAVKNALGWHQKGDLQHWRNGPSYNPFGFYGSGKRCRLRLEGADNTYAGKHPFYEMGCSLKEVECHYRYPFWLTHNQQFEYCINRCARRPDWQTGNKCFVAPTYMIDLYILHVEFPKIDAMDKDHRDFISAFADTVRAGDTVMLKSKKLKFVYCDHRRCHANADCPHFDDARYGDVDRCGGEHITIHRADGPGIIRHRDVVWLRFDNEGNYLRGRRGTNCEAGATCPHHAPWRELKGRWDRCFGERFTIWRARGDGDVHHSDVVWFRHEASQHWLGCDDSNCDVNALCPSSESARHEEANTGCWRERFLILKK